MTEDPRIPNFWWCPTHHLYRGGDKRPCADAVRLVPAPPAPRVFLPNDEVPVGTVLTAKDGSPFRVPDAHTSEGLARVGVPFVEVPVPSPEEWQAAVDRAHAALGGRALTTDAELRALIMSGYFDALADILPPGAIEATEKALTAYNHRGAGRRDEPALMHGVRTLIEFVRADERATAEAAAELKHQRIKALYEQYEADNKAATDRVQRRLTEDVQHSLRAYKTVRGMALTARSAGRKTIPAKDVIEAVGLDDWTHSEQAVPRD